MEIVRKGTEKKAGLPPGTIVHIGEKKLDKMLISIIEYSEDKFEERTVENLQDCAFSRKDSTVTWIDIDGLHDVEVMEGIGEFCGIHQLVLEDVANTQQRPKIEDFGNYIFLVMKMIFYNGKEDKLEFEQISIILGEDFVISFQEGVGDVFDGVRERLRSNKGRTRKMGADFLAYALVDAVVDNYFVILEKFGEKIEDLEEELVSSPSPDDLQALYRLKREMIMLRRSVWPLREVIGGLQRGESPLVKDTTGFYLRDVYDHTIQVIETIETYRDILSGMLDIYLSSISNKMNEIMKVLTIISTIFIPLTFIAGVYGMNFAYMPELKWHWGYPVVVLVMISITLFMLSYFRRKKWL